MLHTQGPVDGSLYAKVRKKSASDPGVPGGAPAVPATASPDHGDHTLSVSSDSGHSTASVRTDRTEEQPAAGPRRGLSPQEKAELDQLLSGFGLEDSGSPLKDMTDAPGKYRGARHVVPAQVHVNGDAALKERETDILDDDMPGHDLHSVDSMGTLSSSEGHQSAHLGPFACYQNSQNSLLSDGFGGSAGEDAHGGLAPDLSLGADAAFERERAFGVREPRQLQPALRTPSVSAQTQAYGQSSYSTHTWVRQQQMVAAQQYAFTPDGEARLGGRGPEDGPGLLQAQPRALVTPTRGTGSRVAPPRAVGPGPQLPEAQRAPPGKAFKPRFPDIRVLNGTGLEPGVDPAPGSPTLDIDQSIEQLNRLILELDPTFEPLPTHMNTPGIQANGPVLPDGVGGGLRDAREGPGRASMRQGEWAVTHRVHVCLTERGPPEERGALLGLGEACREASWAWPCGHRSASGWFPVGLSKSGGGGEGGGRGWFQRVGGRGGNPGTSLCAPVRWGCADSRRLGLWGPDPWVVWCRDQDRDLVSHHGAWKDGWL